MSKGYRGRLEQLRLFDGFYALAANPLGWFVSRAVVYFSAAIVAGIIFVAGSFVYSLFAPPAPPAAPSVITPADTAKIPATTSATAVKGPFLFSHDTPAVDPDSFVGASLVQPDGTPIGNVTSVLVDSTGSASAVLSRPQDELKAVVPMGIVQWHTTTGQDNSFTMITGVVGQPYKVGWSKVSVDSYYQKTP